MIRKLSATLTAAAALLGSSLLAQDNPPQPPRGENPGGERNPRERQPRRPDGEARDPRTPDGERPRQPRGPEGERPPGSPESAPRERQVERPMKPTPYLGLVTSPAPPALAAQIGLGEGFGLVDDDVLPDSPAKTAGVQQHDVIKLLNDQRLTDPTQLATLIRRDRKSVV